MIAIKELNFGYTKHDKLFKNINLRIEKGGICGLLGKNGSGKTTLLKIMAGLIFADKDACEVMGHIPQQRLPSFLDALYFLPEDIFVPALTAEQYVKYYAPFYLGFNHAIFNSHMLEFDLPQNKLLTKFSYGQKKKFLLAFGLATACRLFILDEPTNGLDIPSKAQFRKLLASSITEEKLFIISTHQVRDVENLIDSVIILDSGEVILQQPLYEISKQLAFVQQQTEPDPNACFYCEKHLGGYTAVITNNNNYDTYVDLEILFNAVLLNKQKIQQLFIRD